MFSVFIFFIILGPKKTGKRVTLEQLEPLWRHFQASSDNVLFWGRYILGLHAANGCSIIFWHTQLSLV